MVPVYDVIRALALVVGFAVSLGDRKTSMFADMAFTSWFGAGAIFFPKFFISQQTGKVPKDPGTLYAYRVYGLYLLVPMLMWYGCRKSRDDSVVGSMLWSRTLGLFPLVMVSLYGHLTYSKTFTDRNMWFFILYLGCVWVSNIVQLVRTRPSVGRREQKGPVSIILRLNFIFLFLIGLFSMAFPKMVLSTVTADAKNFDMHLTRVIGALIFSLTFLAWYAPSFRDNEDRRKFFCMELTISCVMLACILYSFFYEKAFNWDQFKVIVPGCLFGLLPLSGLYLMSEGRESGSTTNTYFTRSKAQ